MYNAHTIRAPQGLTAGDWQITRVSKLVYERRGRGDDPSPYLRVDIISICKTKFAGVNNIVVHNGSRFSWGLVLW